MSKPRKTQQPNTEPASRNAQTHLHEAFFAHAEIYRLAALADATRRNTKIRRHIKTNIACTHLGQGKQKQTDSIEPPCAREEASVKTTFNESCSSITTASLHHLLPVIQHVPPDIS